MLRFMLARMAGSGAGIPARMAEFRTGAITCGSAIGAAGLYGAAMGARGVMLEAMGTDGAMSDGATGAGVTLMAAMLSARAAGSGGGIPANTEGSSAAGGEAATS